jgi:hypothetical protein
MSGIICTRRPAKRLTAAERKARAQEQALDDCKHGRHTLKNTFRPQEQVCLICGLVLYCPDCLKEYQLPRVQSERARPLVCPRHRMLKEAQDRKPMEVQA